MLRFKSLSLRNFLSYGNVPTVIQLDQPGTTLVVGEDLDNTERGTGANGVGKTVILNALAYGMYDKAISSISKDNLVNNINKKNMEVAVEFETDGKTYLIRRVRKEKVGAAGNYVQLFEDGHDITPDSVGNTNRLITKIIGFPYELFVRIVAFSATHVPFLDLPVRSPYAANQTDIIEELFDLKTLSEKATVLKETTKETERSLETQMMRVEQLEREHDRHNIQIASAEKRVIGWEQKNKKDIKALEGKLKRLEEVDVDAQRGFHDDLQHVNSELREALEEQRGIERDIKKHTKIANESQRELDHLLDAECPYCKQKFEDTEDNVTECNDVISSTAEIIDGLSPKLNESDDLVESLTITHKEIKGQITVDDLDELVEIKSKHDFYQRTLEELQSATNPFIEPLEELESVELDKIDKEKTNELKNLIDHQKFLIKLLTKKDSFVRKALLNKNIPFLNQRLAHYLTDLGLPHTVEFTHEMTAKISQFSRPMDFGNLSNGQRARVNIALSFAFRDVLQSLHGNINVCMLDEVLDIGLDAVGVQAAAKMLKRKARDEGLSLYIISHRDEIDSAFDRTLTVQMAKGFSYLKYED